MFPRSTAAGRAALLALLLVACPATMHEVEGRRVFNPLYRVFLDTPDRASWQKPDEVIRALGIGEGSTVADVGAGTGYFTVRFARAVGPSGRVLATDVQEEMLAALEERVREEGLANVEVVRAGFDDPTLPPACCDLVFLANVYKEIGDRVPYARKLAAALRPEGRLAVLEYRPGQRTFGPPQEVRLPEEQVVAELGAAGFVPVARHLFLPRQYFLELAPLAERAGVITRAEGGELLFSTRTGALPPGSPVTGVGAPALLSFRVLRRVGTPAEQPGAPLVLVRGVPATAYAIEAAGPLPEDALPAIGVAGDPAGLELGASACTSAEGLHLSLASGEGVARARLWSAYLYLGYDVEPSCAEGEWAD